MLFKEPEGLKLTIFNSEQAREVLGDDFYFDLLEIEEEKILDKTLFGILIAVLS